MKAQIVTLVTLCLVSLAACKDNNGITNETENQPPEPFTLIEVPENSINVDVLPTFTWEASHDPDEDSVRYDLYLGTDPSLDTAIATGIRGTKFIPAQRLSLTVEYYWKVVADDGNGGEVSSETFSFTTRGLTKGTQATAGAAFPSRYLHTSVAFNDRLWVIGGGGGDFDGIKNDVWFSNLGVSWSIVTDSAGFSPRSGHTSVIFDNKIWVIGGYDIHLDRKNDTWFSSNGVNWTEATSTAGFTPRSGHTSVVFDGKIWVVGGSSGAGSYLNNVWCSSDGVNWTEVTSMAGFSRRRNHSSVVFDNKMWVIGGNEGKSYQSDVWYSEDGKNWIQATLNADFSPRYGHTSVVFDEKIWVTGGRSSDGKATNDVWYSSNGINWSKANDSAGFPERMYHTSAVFDNKIWIIAGHDGSYENRTKDVWFMD